VGLMRSELRRAKRQLLRMTPKVCCECKSALRPAVRVEMEVIQRLLREEEWPPDVNGQELIGAKVCVNCGHVTVLTYSGETLAVWCPGFGLHERVVASAN
jgi:hypothetical protein